MSYLASRGEVYFIAMQEFMYGSGDHVGETRWQLPSRKRGRSLEVFWTPAFLVRKTLK